MDPKQTGKRALVVEGGGMRGIFSAGVLDAFLEAGFDPFDMYIGVSAGACNLSSHVAGQHGRNLRIYTNQMLRPEFMSLRRMLLGGHYMDLDWLWETFQREDPLDVLSADKAIKNKEFIVVCTSVATGSAVYLRPVPDNWASYLKASSCVPVLYRGGTRVDGEWLVDGGVADPLPIHAAISRGARDLWCIRSRPDGYKKISGLETRWTAWMLRRHPRLKQAIQRQPEVYMKATALIDRPPAGVRIHHIHPPRALRTRRTSQNLDGLMADYRLGRGEGIAAMEGRSSSPPLSNPKGRCSSI